VGTSPTHPAVIDKVAALNHFDVLRQMDRAALQAAASNGGLNGHVPITYMFLAIGVLQLVLTNQNTLLMAAGQEGEEPYAYVDDLAIRHQWSKTWQAEQLFADYVQTNIASSIQVGSPLRAYSELKVAELFYQRAWQKFGHSFSSCNIANYKQGQANEQLQWCGNCAKCANSFLLFAAFVPLAELVETFGSNVFENPNLLDDFKGLLGIEGYAKPFECVGTTEELRKAYELSQANGYRALPFDVPTSDFDYGALGPAQAWASQMVQ
jgi:hypothetical protein